MNAHVELNLAMILFLPWFLILGALFWIYPRGPRGLARNLFDAGSLLLATLAGLWGTWWSIDHADPGYGNLWKQILASTISYGMFLGVMCAAITLRWYLMRSRTTALSKASP